jgi:quercetin dioxygenase-like cupin family protein
MAFVRAVVSLSSSPKLGRGPTGAPILIHATGEQTNGAFGMWENFVPPGKGPDAHTHSRETEVFRVIAGTFRFNCGDQTFEAPPGSVVTLPPHVEHVWTNIGDTMGQMMAIVSPAGFEQFFIEIAKLSNPTPRDIALIERRLGVESEETRRL